ncbi:hypothetical protein CRENBAI_019881 [Crenichthys baileyi]|uniref:Uncharacterized protein n=1 Tax=Crenichthys baileyi TaxID=28760 RepID=A0AAV9R3E2_9TELE
MMSKINSFKIKQWAEGIQVRRTVGGPSFLASETSKMFFATVSSEDKAKSA